MVRKKNKMFVDSADRTPHYSLRKLSVGVASVLLSTTLWMGANGSVAHADTIDDATVAGKASSAEDPSETLMASQMASKDQKQAQTAESTSQASVASAEKQNGEAQNGQDQAAVADANQAENKQAQEGSNANAEGQTMVLQNSSDAATEDAKSESTTLDVSQAFKMPINKKMVMASLASAAQPTNTADSISENKPTATTTVPGFSVTDPEYPSGMYRDPNPEHYSFFWVGQNQKDNGYQTVISTNRNGDGQIHVFELDQSNNVLNSFDLDKNQSRTSRKTGFTYFNDEYAGLVHGVVHGVLKERLTLKYEISGVKTDQPPLDNISFIVPRLNTQVTSYHDEDGNDIIDNNGEKIESVVQQGLDGQKYTTTGTKVIDGYYAKAPFNAQGTMSPYGKIGSKYEKNFHNGYIAEFTQINNAGDMSVQMYHEDRQGNRTPVARLVTIKPGDTYIYSYGRNNKIFVRSIYVPQTIDITYVYKKLGNTVLVDEDNNPFKGNTPTQYPNDPNDPTKAGKVVIPQYEGYTPKINGVPVGPDGFIPTDPGEDTIVVYTANSARALVRFIDNTENRTLDELESKGKTGETIDFAKANAQLKSYLDRGYKLVANGIPTTETKFDTSDDTNGPSQVFVVQLDHTMTPGETTVPGKQTVTYVYKDKDGKVPEVPGWTPKNGKPGDPVTPKDPTKDTEVPYDHTMTPGETTATGKVEGLPEKPAKSAKAPAEKLVKTPVKAPKAVKEAAPAEMPAQRAAQAQDQLPQTGEDNSKAAFGLGLASILGGIGILGAFKRKKKEN